MIEIELPSYPKNKFDISYWLYKTEGLISFCLHVDISGRDVKLHILPFSGNVTILFE